MKKILYAMLAILMCMALITGCGDDVVYTGTTSKTDSDTTNTDGGKNDVSKLLDINEIERADDNVVVDDDYAVRDPQKGETVAVIHTNMGEIKMRFLDEIAPLATNNFIALAENGRYDKTIFHRVIANFMIQGGGYTNFDGTGGVSAYGVEFDNEVSEYASNVRGSVAMANAGPNTNGSQFYINQNNADNTYLDGGYTVFGWVYEGMDVVDAIAAVSTDYSDRPLEDVVIEYVEILEY